MNDIETRLAKLERSNRRWRWCSAMLLGFAALGGLTALQPIDTRPMVYRPAGYPGDPGFAIGFQGSEVGAAQKQVDAIDLTISGHERRIAALERIAELAGPPCWHSRGQGVYHDNLMCTEGAAIEERDLVRGAGDKKLCEHCERLDGIKRMRPVSP